ncbi:membrane protein DedA with SNARE-associated domain [Paenibacillus cellulosilyticus]|uniref:Membrane protein DedA with SNARE-associated domain n=1 Tax=Paenibacillus cellulosilyticus TaxID=375489 RepID=A0A2V2YUK8_9BACL|nr:DedA family protein [Paenibacillus cellulosilyticus]PWW04775.1 membrane protein DedA with SNARE-associated domain [Paenibacillus cellulosilyticus]QKS45898.1 DedA family protein [Paenibacillus cellulosilyticus]
MHQLIDWFSRTAIHLIDTLGLTGIFIGMILESACIPIPSEVILLGGGAASALGSMTYWGVVAAGVFGNLVGSIIAYYIGALGGRRLLEQYGKYILFKQSHYEQAQRWFDRHGELTVLIARNLPFVRTFISLPAGIASMRVTKFILFTFIGCIPWNMALAFAGYKLGQSDQIERILHPLSYGIAGIILVAGLFWLLKKRRGIH